MIGYSKNTQLAATKKKKTQMQRNKTANEILDDIYHKKGIDYCEIKLSPHCLKKEVESYGQILKLTYAHKHKRIFYRKKENRKKLHSFFHTVRACIPCHEMIEYDRKLTMKVFAKLRPPTLT